VILEPVAQDWAWLDAVVGPVDEDFEHAAREQPAEQERPELAELFK
jgi:antitoxin VapB